MKSKTLSFNMVKETWKRQLWVFAVSCLVYFVSYPLSGLLNFDNWSGMENIKGEALKRVFFYTLYGTPSGNGGDLPEILLMAVFLGIVCAVSSFSYLHSRTKVDFYHSLPIRREKLFLYQLLASVINYLIPASVGMLMLMGVSVLKGAFSPAAFGAGLASVLVGLVLFLMSFAVSALAMMLTGRILVGILGIVVFFGYSFYLHILSDAYGDWFFDTFAPGAVTNRGLWEYGTPFGWTIKIGNSLNLGDGWMLALAAFVFTLLLLVLGVWVYKKRPAEAAGNSMAFSLAAEVIKVILVSSAALGMGIIFVAMVDHGRDGWFVFGLVFGVLLFYGVIQMIYHMDIKMLWKGKWQLLCSAFLVGIVALVCRMDLFGYDTYLPRQESIKNLNILTDGGFYENMGMYLSGEDNFGGLEMGCDDLLYQNVQDIIDASEKYKEMQKNPSEENAGSMISVRLKYEKKNGRCGYRNYTVYFSDVAEIMKQLYDRREYLEGLYPILTAEEKSIGEICILTAQGYKKQLYGEQEDARLRLVDALKKDMENLDGELVSKEFPLARISYTLYEPNTRVTPLDMELQEYGEAYMYGGSEKYCYVYSSFVHTIALLKEEGFDLSKNISKEDVKKICISVNKSDDESDLSEEIVYTDAEEIEVLLDAAVCIPFATEWYEYENTCTMQVVWKNGEDGDINGTWLLIKDRVPEFLKEKM